AGRAGPGGGAQPGPGDDDPIAGRPLASRLAARPAAHHARGGVRQRRPSRPVPDGAAAPRPRTRARAVLPHVGGAGDAAPRARPGLREPGDVRPGAEPRGAGADGAHHAGRAARRRAARGALAPGPLVPRRRRRPLRLRRPEPGPGPAGRGAQERSRSPCSQFRQRLTGQADSGPSAARKTPTPASSSLITSSLHAGYPGEAVLHGIDLAVHAGDPPLGLLGASGAGKTTLLSTLSGEL